MGNAELLRSEPLGNLLSEGLEECVPPEARNSELEFLAALLERIPEGYPRVTVTEHAEARRILPPDTPFPGPWRVSKTPYMREIMDNLSVSSPIQHTVFLKSAQIGATTAAENIIAYWMSAIPAPILYISGTEELLRRWAGQRLEPLIDCFGMRDLMRQEAKASRSRQTGDKVLQKTFPGGFLMMSSAQSGSGQRAMSSRVLIRDEIDSAPADLKGGEGKWIQVSWARTTAFGPRRKVFDLSTPTTYTNSQIYPLFLEGDQRYYHVPCPKCGATQPLDWGSESGNHGIRVDKEAGKIKEVYYLCDHCHDSIHEYHKPFMLRNGMWVPTKDDAPTWRRSYQMSSLYSPPGMVTWREIYDEWVSAEQKNDMAPFTNLRLGMPFRDVGERPKFDQVIELRGGYQSRTIPTDEILFLTMSVDVQSGSAKIKSRGARLEVEVCGHGRRRQTWSIEHRVIKGEILDPAAGAWAELSKALVDGEFAYNRPGSSKVARPVMCMIDSGSGEHTDIVYEFCKGRRNTYPLKGQRELRPERIRLEKGDERDRHAMRRFTRTNVGPNLELYIVSTNYYKTEIYKNLRRSYERLDSPDDCWGFCHFPSDYADAYFDQLRAEEKRADGSFHRIGERPNEALDLRVYNMAAGDIYLENLVEALRMDAKVQKVDPRKIAKINIYTILDRLEKQVKG